MIPRAWTFLKCRFLACTLLPSPSSPTLHQSPNPSPSKVEATLPRLEARVIHGNRTTVLLPQCLTRLSAVIALPPACTRFLIPFPLIGRHSKCECPCAIKMWCIAYSDRASCRWVMDRQLIMGVRGKLDYIEWNGKHPRRCLDLCCGVSTIRLSNPNKANTMVTARRLGSGLCKKMAKYYVRELRSLTTFHLSSSTSTHRLVSTYPRSR